MIDAATILAFGEGDAARIAPVSLVQPVSEYLMYTLPLVVSTTWSPFTAVEKLVFR